MGLFDPQGISSSPSTQSVVTSGINTWAQPYVFNYLNRGNALLNQGPSDFQKQVWSSAQGLQTPAQFAAGSDLAQRGGEGALSTAPMALNYGQMGADVGSRGIGIGQAGMQYGMGAGANYANQATNPGAVGAYMNPFIQNALAPQMQLLNQQQQLAAQNINAKAAGQGAFGGNRATLAQGLNAQNYDLARQQAMGQAYTDAFKQAQQAQQFGAQLGLQGAMQGTQAGLSGLGTALQGTGLGLQGVQGAQQGYQGATQAGAALGNIGAQQGQFQLGALALQNQIANQQYNQPYQQLNFMQGLMSGLPVTTSTTQGYQAGQNPWLQGIGAAGTLASYAPNVWNTGKDIWNWATGGGGGGGGIPFGGDARDIGLAETSLSGASYADLPYDVLSAKGGQITSKGVKRYADGGIASINRKVMNDPTAYSDQTINQGAQNNILGGVTKLLALDTIAKQRAALQAQQAMQAQPKPPVAQQLAQQAMMGIDSAESNLPQQYAGGGIIAFEEGGDVPFPEKIQDLPAYLRKKVPSMDRFLNAFNLENIREQINQGTNNPVPTTAPAAETPAAPAKNTGIVIHDNAPKSAGIAAPAAPVVPMQPSRVDSGSGIDALTKRYEDMIRGGEDFKNAEKRAETNAMRKLFLNMMNPERGASFVAGLGGAGLKAQEALEKEQEGIQTRKDAQIGKLVSLGLKGQDLKNELNKLGITEEYYRAHYPLLAAQAQYYASGKGKGAGITGGAITPAVADKVIERFDAYRQDYKNPSNPYVAMLTPLDQTYLQKGSGKSLANARAKLDAIIDAAQQKHFNALSGYNVKRPVE